MRSATTTGTTVYTYRLAGGTLDGLLDAAQRDVWPNSQCEREWDLLRNWALQTETFQADESESLAWAQRMRELNTRQLDYPEWVAERLTALEERMRARKLTQANLRYAYGYRGKRSARLIRAAVRNSYQRWASEPSDV